MARHLARPEFDLAVWNRTLPKAEAMASELGVRYALTPADAARESGDARWLNGDRSQRLLGADRVPVDEGLAAGCGDRCQRRER